MNANTKILYLADADSTHTFKWLSNLSVHFKEIYLFSFRLPHKFKYPENVKIYTANNDLSNLPDINKLKYLKSFKYLKRLSNQINPDIVHAFYASSYGLMGALLNPKRYYISVWGSDVFDFPSRSILHKKILKFNLSKAHKIFATSNALKKQTQQFITKQPIFIIPFGVDIQLFEPRKKTKNKSHFIFGTIKALEDVYNIEGLIHSFYTFLQTQENNKNRFRLVIAGEGSKKNVLINLVKRLNIEPYVEFKGFVPQQDIPNLLACIDVFMVLSKRESFGVAAVEALACGVPVIASNIEGLNEVVLHNVNGFLVNPFEHKEVAKVMNKLFSNNDLREQFGRKGVEIVKNKFDFEKNVNDLLQHY